MVNGDTTPNGPTEIDSELAKDVANLYSWANVEHGYRDFSNQRRTRVRKNSTDEDIRRIEDVQTGGPTFESAPQAPAVIEPEAPINPPAAQTVEPSVPEPLDLAPSDLISDLPAASHAVEAVAVPNAVVADVAPRSSPEPYTPAIFFEVEPEKPAVSVSPALAVYSLAGGVGKTTFVANLGRVLCSLHEKVLLVDSSGSGLLPFYFGASDLRSGLRTFVSPDGLHSPLHVIGTEDVTASWVEKDVKSAMRNNQRTIFDLGPASAGFLAQIFGMCGTVLIPLLPDLNSILSVSRIESMFKSMQCNGVVVPDHFYVFNRFDSLDSIDRRARALVERQCGDRLLQITIRDGAEVAKAIASRMTVADHAPESDVAHDFMQLAEWARRRAPVKAGSSVQLRWSER